MVCSAVGLPPGALVSTAALAAEVMADEIGDARRAATRPPYRHEEPPMVGFSRSCGLGGWDTSNRYQHFLYGVFNSTFWSHVGPTSYLV